MGACTFGVLKVGRYKNASEAYVDAVEEAQWEDGHDGYNGTISTTHGFRMVKTKHRFNNKSFDKWEEEMLENLDKRDCVCYELTNTALKTAKERRGYKGKKNIKAYYFFGWAAE